LDCSDPNCSASMYCPGGSCTTDCEAGTHQCQAHVPASLTNDYDLSKDASEYAQFASLGIVNVGIDAVYFNITQNTLTVTTPQLSVYAGPQTIHAPTDPGAQLIGTIPSVQRGQTGRVNVVFSGNGQATIKMFMDNFKTPFRVLVAGDIVVV